MSDFRARLYLITPPLTAASEVSPAIEAALGAGDVACLLLRLASLPDRDAKDLVRQLAPLAQRRDTALLLEDARLAAHTGADGVHINGMGEAVMEALESLKPERIVGSGGLATRDDAMAAGESGVDYLMFGGPWNAGGTAAETLEWTQWWAEIFNVPCVGFAETLGDVEALAEAGAEFVALADAVWRDPRGPAAAVVEAEAAIARGAARAALGEKV